MTLVSAFLSGPIYAQGAPKSLTIEQAVSASLQHSNGIEGALADWHSAQEKAAEARLQQLPSVKLSGSYMRLSKVPGSSIPLGPTTTLTLPASPENAFNFAVDLQYPIFAGFRLKEAVKLAELQSAGKKIGVQIVRQALRFEVRRAYWEAVRASAAVSTMKKNLDLVGVMRKEVEDEVTQGLATQSDLLQAEDRYNQAQLMLTDAISGRNKALLALSSFMGDDSVGALIAGGASAGFSLDAKPVYDLSTKASGVQFPKLEAPIDPQKLLSDALSNRPETQTATVGVESARHAKMMSQAGLFPTLALIGNYTYADPNQRIFPTVDGFKGTWNVGVALSFDVGKLPANVAGSTASADALKKAEAQAAQARESVVLDVRTTLLSYEQAKQDLGMTKGMVTQATESLRVTRQKYENGLAKHSDVLQAEVSLLRAQYGVINKEVDVRIAAADLARASALDLMQ